MSEGRKEEIEDPLNSCVCVCVCVCVCLCVCVVVFDCSPPGCFVCGTLQARILEWAIPFSRGSSWPLDWTQVSWVAGRFFIIWDLKQLCHPLMDQDVQELTWLSCFHSDVVLWNILTISSMCHYKFKEDSLVISEFMPFGYLLFWFFKEFMNSLALNPNFWNQKSYLGSNLMVFAC